MASKDSGLLMVGFNTDQVDSYGMISSQTYTVAKGSGTHMFTATATPANWGPIGTFQAYVNLSENPRPSSWTPLAGDKKRFLYLRVLRQLSAYPQMFSSRGQIPFNAIMMFVSRVHIKPMKHTIATDGYGLGDERRGVTRYLLSTW